jgi:hypothetical protein
LGNFEILDDLALKNRFFWEKINCFLPNVILSSAFLHLNNNDPAKFLVT